MQKILKGTLITFLMLIFSTAVMAAPAAPTITYQTNGFDLTISWSEVPEAASYTLYYAPYPYTGPETIGSMQMAQGATSFSASLWENAAYYIAVTSSNQQGESQYSNIEYFIMGSKAAIDDSDFEPTDWSDSTHSKSVDPNFAEVFDDTQVKRLDIVVSEERWQSMLDNMTELYGEFGRTTSGQLPGGPPQEPVAAPDSPPGTVIATEEIEDPIFVPAEIFYNGLQWYRVGIRFKGNSSLQGSWQQGILKLSFKLDFDEYEDDYPQINNQRFYGFKKLSLKNNFNDKSLLREKVAAEVFADAGVAVSHTAFYALYVDHGNGPEYFGLYTLVEEVGDTLIETQFSSDDGNLYKPEDGSASFVAGTFNSEDFEKKTNEDEADWSDIEALFSALHAETRTSDPASWRADLEAVFDVDTFLKYLAVNGIIQNWDTYGRMPHNFYLYNNLDSSQLTWIPWDHNEALQEGNRQGSLALDFSNLQSDSWPLIEKIYADEVYKAKYDGYVAEVIESAFATSVMQSTYAAYAALVRPYAEQERQGYSFLNSINDFDQAIVELNLHAESRATAVDSYLSSNE